MKKFSIVKLISTIFVQVLLTVLMSVSVFAASAIWNGTVASGFASGAGTENDPYIIKTAEQLAFLAQSTNSGTTYAGQYIKLANDIRLNDTTNWKNWDKTAPKNEWTPIGASLNRFSGAFDGDGHEISGIYINASSSYQGLFGYIYYGTVKNVGVVDSYIKGTNYIGSIAGNIVARKKNGTAIIKNCYNTGTISGISDVGGIAGETSADNLGRIIADNCYNAGNISCLGHFVGGIVGTNLGTIRNCYNTGAVSGDGYIGGIVGHNNNDNNNSAGTTSNCHNVGNTTGNYCVGNIIGINHGTVYCCYYLEGCATDENGTVQYGIGNETQNSTTVGLTAEQMKTKDSFKGFNFIGVWKIAPNINGGYPCLRTFPLQIDNVAVYINDKYVKFDVQPIIIDGRTLVPVRAIFEALGARVDWDDKTKTVIGEKDGTTIIMPIGKDTFTVSGEIKVLDVPAQIINGRTLVPVRAIAESLGVVVTWDGNEKAVNIFGPVSTQVPNSLNLAKIDSEALIKFISPYFDALYSIAHEFIGGVEIPLVHSGSYILIDKGDYEDWIVLKEDDFDSSLYQEKFFYNGNLITNYKDTGELYDAYLNILSNYVDLNADYFAHLKNGIGLYMLGYIDHQGKLYSYRVYLGTGISWTYFKDSAKLIEAHGNTFVIEAECGRFEGNDENTLCKITFEYKNGKLIITNVD